MLSIALLFALSLLLYPPRILEPDPEELKEDTAQAIRRLTIGNEEVMENSEEMEALKEEQNNIPPEIR
jgi:hypothetical protein